MLPGISVRSLRLVLDLPQINFLGWWILSLLPLQCLGSPRVIRCTGRFAAWWLYVILVPRYDITGYLPRNQPGLLSSQVLCALRLGRRQLNRWPSDAKPLHLSKHSPVWCLYFDSFVWYSVVQVYAGWCVTSFQRKLGSLVLFNKLLVMFTNVLSPLSDLPSCGS